MSSRSVAALFAIDVPSLRRRSRSFGSTRIHPLTSSRRTSASLPSEGRPLGAPPCMMNTLWVTELATTEFEPVLNVPAFTSFALIAVVFGLLQWRIRGIEQAVGKRREALKALRNAKSLQISKGEGTDAAILALEAYRTAYESVEDLRQIAPGVRIRAPGVVDDENQRAAQQFLGITTDEPEQPPENPIAPKLAAGVLVVIGMSQLALLFFLLFQDDPFQGIM